MDSKEFVDTSPLEGLYSGRILSAVVQALDIEDEDIPAHRVESLAFSTTFMRILAGCYQEWMKERDDWMPLANFLKDARLETGGGRGTLLVDAGAMLPGDNAPSGRRQEVEGAISYIVQHAGQTANSDAFDEELPW